MGYGEFGGGGSVLWTVDIDEGDIAEATPKGKKGKDRGYTVKSHDKHGKHDTDESTDYFEVTIEQPSTEKVVFRRVGNKLYLYLPVDQKNDQQVKVRWALKHADLPPDAKPL